MKKQLLSSIQALLLLFAVLSCQTAFSQTDPPNQVTPGPIGGNTLVDAPTSNGFWRSSNFVRQDVNPVLAPTPFAPELSNANPGFCLPPIVSPFQMFRVGENYPLTPVRACFYGGNVGQTADNGAAFPIGSTAVGARWSVLGDRVPFVGPTAPPGARTTGLRTQWDQFGVNFGLIDRAGGALPLTRDASVIWQDGTITNVTTAIADNARLKFIFRDNQTPNLANSTIEHATILATGNFGIGTPNPLVKLQVENGNIGQVTTVGGFGIPTARWMAMGAGNTPSPTFTNYHGTFVNWNQRGFVAGMIESAGERDGLIAWQDQVAGGPSNRLRIGFIDGFAAAAVLNEWATVQGNNGFMGVGTATASFLGRPQNRLHLHDYGTNQNTFMQVTTTSTGLLPTDGFRIGVLNLANQVEINQRENADMYFSTNNIERLRITAGGNMGLGTAAPFNKYHVNEPIAGNPAYTQTTNTGTGPGVNDGLVVGVDATGEAEINQREALPLKFFTTNNERMRIDGGGNVSIGTAVTGASLEVWNQAGANGFRVSDAGGGVDQLVVDGTGFVGINTPVALIPGGLFTGLVAGAPPIPAPPLGNIKLSVLGDITQLGGDFATQGDVYAISDSRFKKDFTELNRDESWKRVLNITPYSYRIDGSKLENTENSDRLHYGFKAQDVAATIPELTKKWGEAYVVNYIGFVPFLTAGLKEHEERIAAIESGAAPQAAPAQNGAEMEGLKNDLDKLSKENQDLRNENTAVLERLKALEDKLSGICSLPCVQEAINQNSQSGTLTDQPQLFQNEPNPFGSITVIKYYVPVGAKTAMITIADSEGKNVGNFELKKGSGNLQIAAGTLAAGAYNYSLYVDNNLITTKKMVIINY